MTRRCTRTLLRRAGWLQQGSGLWQHLSQSDQLPGTECSRAAACCSTCHTQLGCLASLGEPWHCVQEGLGRVKVWAISFGQIRDLWVPMLVLAVSLSTALAAGYQVATSSAW